MRRHLAHGLLVYKGSSKRAEWGVTLAMPVRQSPLQAIEKNKLRGATELSWAASHGDRQAFGRNRKLLGLRARNVLLTGKTAIA